MCGGNPAPPPVIAPPVPQAPAQPKQPKGGTRRRRQADSATRSKAGAANQVPLGAGGGTLLAQNNLGIPNLGKTLLGA